MEEGETLGAGVVEIEVAFAGEVVIVETVL